MTAHPEVRPMQPEGVELVRRSCEAFNDRDLDELVKLYHQGCIWDMSKFAGWPENAVYRGHAGLRIILAEWEAAWEDVHFEPTDTWLVGERSLITCNLRGRRRVSGQEAEIRWMQVGETRDGLIYRVDNYTDMEEALAAVGLMAQHDSH
jgi:ketosteroid isomerase-like protein